MASRTPPLGFGLFVWQAIVPAGGLSGRRLRHATDFSGFYAEGFLNWISSTFVSFKLKASPTKSPSREAGYHPAARLGRFAAVPWADDVGHASAREGLAPIFCGFVYSPGAALQGEKLVAYPKRRPERPPAGTIACRTKRQSPEAGYHHARRGGCAAHGAGGLAPAARCRLAHIRTSLRLVTERDLRLFVDD